MEPEPAKTSTKFLSIISNCKVLKRDSFKIPFELRVVKISGISIFLPLCVPAVMVVVNILIFSFDLMV